MLSVDVVNQLPILEPNALTSGGSVPGHQHQLAGPRRVSGRPRDCAAPADAAPVDGGGGAETVNSGGGSVANHGVNSGW